MFDGDHELQGQFGQTYRWDKKLKEQGEHKAHLTKYCIDMLQDWFTWQETFEAKNQNALDQLLR